MTHEVVGSAYYCGKDEDLIKKFDRFKPTELYNCEGFYVLDNEGNQVVIDSDWTKKVEKHKTTLLGKGIVMADTHHEHIIVVDKDDIAYFLHPMELVKLFKKQKFKVELKRTRVWITKSKSK